MIQERVHDAVITLEVGYKYGRSKKRACKRMSSAAKFEAACTQKHLKTT
jgi:hypothetical protein